MNNFEGFAKVDKVSILQAVSNRKRFYDQTLEKYNTLLEKSKTDYVDKKFLFFKYKVSKYEIAQINSVENYYPVLYTLDEFYPNELSSDEFTVLRCGEDHLQVISNLAKSGSNHIYLNPEQCRLVEFWKDK